MALHVFNDMFDGTIRPPEKIRPGLYRVEVFVGYRDGSSANAQFSAEGKTAKQAEAAALEKAREAIAAGKVQAKE